jgi:hypothetical protein
MSDEGASAGGSRAAEALATPVHAGGAYKAFGELTRAEVRARGDELAEVGASGGPLQRVIPVARAWRALAGEMEQAGAATVADLEPEAVAAAAERVWVLPPEEGMI